VKRISDEEIERKATYGKERFYSSMFPACGRQESTEFSVGITCTM